MLLLLKPQCELKGDKRMETDLYGLLSYQRLNGECQITDGVCEDCGARFGDRAEVEATTRAGIVNSTLG